MNQKTVIIVAVSLAVISAAVSAIVVSRNRVKVTEAYESAQIAGEEAKSAEAKKAQSEKEAAEANRAAKEAEEKAKKLELEVESRKAEQLKDERKKAEEDAKIAAETAKAKAAQAEIDRAVRDTEKAKAAQETAAAAKAKDLAKAEQAKTAAEEARASAEKLKLDRVLEEARLMELRKADLESLERELVAWKQDLEERERALMPEKTIADLAWAGGQEDTIIDETGQLKKQVKVEYNAEKDMSLPAETRRLVRQERLVRQGHDESAAAVQARVRRVLESLYIEALRQGRVIDADYYKKNIQQMIPDWKGPDLKVNDNHNKGEKNG